MPLKEKYNLENPDSELIARDGWWLMRLVSDTPETALEIGLLPRDGFGWGYWDADENGNKEWIRIAVPEEDATKLSHSPNYFELGRVIAFAAIELTPERLIRIIRASCESEQDRVECLKGFYAARTYWNLPMVHIDESDLLSHE